MMATVYQKADEAMRLEIKRYLVLADITEGFTSVSEQALSDPLDRLMFSAGIGMHTINPNQINPSHLVNEWKRKRAVPFDIERSITIGVYNLIRPFADEL